jgi:hypothetical protein
VVGLVLAGAVIAGTAVGCPARAPREHWRLVQPPEVADAEAPKGVRLLPKASLDQWRQVGMHGSQEACLAAKKRDIEREVKRARAELGDDAAKYAVPLRRAVNGRCVREE